MSDLFAVSISDMIAEQRRELALRETLYPRFVASKKLTQAKADRQIAVMRATIAHLEESA